MALRLLPFRDYSEHSVIGIFANQNVDNKPDTNGDGSNGVFVKVLSGDLNKDVIEYGTAAYLGKTNYPYVGAAQYPEVPLRVTAATTGVPCLGITLKQTLAYDENDEKLIYHRVKQDELNALVSGQAGPVATRGIFTLSDSAYDDSTTFAPGNMAVLSLNAGKITGVAPVAMGGKTVVGHILATGSRVSQNGENDQFAGTTTGKYALIQLDCAANFVGTNASN